jgi:hypothetical protein
MTYKIDIPKEFILTCTYPMCNEHGDIYRHPDQEGEDATQVEILCEEHAPKFGFCKGCGSYCAGLESFDFVPKVWGYCVLCGEQFESVDDEDEEEYDQWGNPLS